MRRTGKLGAMLLWLLALLAVSEGVTAPMSPLERQRLLTHYEMTESWLADELSGLTAQQLSYRPSPGSWSILEVLEHLVISEAIYWQDFQRAMQAPPSGRRSNAGDDDILWYGIDRTYREKAIPPEEARGKLKEATTGLREFRATRRKIVDYVKTTQEDLRSRIVPRQGCDAYQWLLLITSHCQRHILQIREIKKSPGFPPGK